MYMLCTISRMGVYTNERLFVIDWCVVEYGHIEVMKVTGSRYNRCLGVHQKRNHRDG